MIRQNIIILLALLSQAYGFAPHTPLTSRASKSAASRKHIFSCAERFNTRLNLSAAASALPDAASMRASELRKELQAYGISTKSFFEKYELVNAVNKARAEGKTPKDSGNSSSGGTSAGGASRSERLKKEIEKCKTMRVAELRKELQSFGISTKSFFEKSEFVRALAEVRVDGAKKEGASAGKSEEPYDPSYRDVVMRKMTGDKMSVFPVIDITLAK
mmetsp:Transcript_21578/g.31504  ORF Transcript_21578/g.31504 Transcript_21578/m.31504 type:complete len:217 (-) Transcript_21578:96-746(-)|eukprot:CAMPEP_0197236264 /NCGR_PEP_ID=MMETSP1429-20130617/3436_1 /TAXON_ID=49237 /ORGANISM="Chaetoceros  sp., Strain UNC1202" /LENGTH=216 /DNA_ID=CAMNT_0042695019 /DNA_START=69 /DNA_END=719 /DNA_ORIENTATION=+